MLPNLANSVLSFYPAAQPHQMSARSGTLSSLRLRNFTLRQFFSYLTFLFCLTAKYWSSPNLGLVYLDSCTSYSSPIP